MKFKKLMIMKWKTWSSITNFFGYTVCIVIGVGFLLLSILFIFKNKEYLTGIEFLFLSVYSFFYKKIKDKNFVVGMAIIFFTIVHFLILIQEGILTGNNLFYIFITISLFFIGIFTITKKTLKKTKKPHT